MPLGFSGTCPSYEGAYLSKRCRKNTSMNISSNEPLSGSSCMVGSLRSWMVLVSLLLLVNAYLGFKTKQKKQKTDCHETEPLRSSTATRSAATRCHTVLRVEDDLRNEAVVWDLCGVEVGKATGLTGVEGSGSVCSGFDRSPGRTIWDLSPSTGSKLLTPWCDPWGRRPQWRPTCASAAPKSPHVFVQHGEGGVKAIDYGPGLETRSSSEAFLVRASV